MTTAAGTTGLVAWEREHFFSRLLWLFPLTYLLHIFEELHGFPDWVNDVLHGRFSSAVFYLANAWFMFILLALTRLASRRRPPLTLGLLFFFSSGQCFWDAVLHIYAENHFGTYSPGYFTSVFLYVPTYAYLVYVALRERFISPTAWALGFVAGIFLLLFVVWAGLYRFSPIPWGLWG